MRRHLLPEFALASLLGLAAVTGLVRPAPAGAQVQWSGVERVVAFADVHGAYTELVTLLRETGIVDAQDRWAAGRTHVVSLGDLLDRGADSRKVMDLLMRLQGEAQAAGGRLHVVLGNHEAMNVLGDLRYVDPGEFAAYADVESATERANRRKAWEAAQGAGSGPAFDQKFPPGYFGHRAALSPRGTYGQWLLSLPVAIAINDTLFMHAGPSNVLRGMSLQEVNLRYRTALTEYLDLADRLEQARLLQPGDEFDARPKLARERLAAMTTAAAAGGGATDGALTDAVQRFQAADDDALLSADGPNWYRGAALCNEAAENDVLQPLLQQFGVARLVVGHTPTRDLRAVTRFDGRVVKLDAGMNRAAYKGRAVALFLQPAGLSVRYAGEPDARPLQPEGLFVAPNEIDDASVLATLRDGEVTVAGPRGPNELNVSVSHAGKRIPAVFQARTRRCCSQGSRGLPARSATRPRHRAGHGRARGAGTAGRAAGTSAEVGHADRGAAATARRRLVQRRAPVPARLCVRHADRQRGPRSRFAAVRFQRLVRLRYSARSRLRRDEIAAGLPQGTAARAGGRASTPGRSAERGKSGDDARRTGRREGAQGDPATPRRAAGLACGGECCSEWTLKQTQAPRRLPGAPCAGVGVRSSRTV